VPSEVVLNEEDAMKSPIHTRIVIPNGVRDLQLAASHRDAGKGRACE